MKVTKPEVIRALHEVEKGKHTHSFYMHRLTGDLKDMLVRAVQQITDSQKVSNDTFTVYEEVCEEYGIESVSSTVPEKPKKFNPYSFVVWEKNEFDFNRVVREMDKDANGFFLLSPDSYVAILVLKRSFVKQFQIEDKIVVANERLCPYWGYARQFDLFDGIFVVSEKSRFDYVTIAVDVLRMGETVKELKQAIMYLEKNTKCQAIRNTKDHQKVTVRPF
jgi:hypothetical protein